MEDVQATAIRQSCSEIPHNFEIECRCNGWLLSRAGVTFSAIRQAVTAVRRACMTADTLSEIYE
jgi:hypothetical protein